MSQSFGSENAHFQSRVEFLRTVHFEANRAKLDPQLVLAVIQVESNFRKYAVFALGRSRLHAGHALLGGLAGTPRR